MHNSDMLNIHNLWNWPLSDIYKVL